MIDDEFFNHFFHSLYMRIGMRSNTIREIDILEMIKTIATIIMVLVMAYRFE